MHTDPMSSLDNPPIDQICLGLAKAPIAGVREAFASRITSVINAPATFHEKEILWVKFFENRGRLYDVLRLQVALIAATPTTTIYVCNLADGWLSLYNNVVSEKKLDAFFFRATINGAVLYPVYEMLAWKHGNQNRHLRCLKDDVGWNFINSGEPVAFENPSVYQRRSIKNRLNADIIFDYSEAAGYRITDVLKFTGFCYHFKRSTPATGD